jgi:AbrB family looped-hinge helix DNA binding protein
MPRITSKGQLTIPAHVREKLGLHPGTEIEFFIKDDELYIAKAGTAASMGLEPWKPEPRRKPRELTTEELEELLALVDLAPDDVDEQKRS